MQREEELPAWRGLLEAGSRTLARAGIGEADLDAWYLLSKAFGIDRAYYYMEQNRPVPEGAWQRGMRFIAVI